MHSFVFSRYDDIIVLGALNVNLIDHDHPFTHWLESYDLKNVHDQNNKVTYNLELINDCM